MASEAMDINRDLDCIRAMNSDVGPSRSPGPDITMESLSLFCRILVMPTGWGGTYQS